MVQAKSRCRKTKLRVSSNEKIHRVILFLTEGLNTKSKSAILLTVTKAIGYLNRDLKRPKLQLMINFMILTEMLKKWEFIKGGRHRTISICQKVQIDRICPKSLERSLNTKSMGQTWQNLLQKKAEWAFHQVSEI